MLAKVQDESGWPILDTPDGERWLQTEMGQEYLRSEVGIAWAHDKEEKRKAAEAKAKAEAEAEAARIKAEEEAEAARLKAMARQLAFAEAWGSGWLARAKYSITKKNAIEEARQDGRVWADGGGGLLKKRKKKAIKETSAAEVMKGYVANAAPELLRADGTPVDEATVSNALVKAANAAAEIVPVDESKSKLTTRKFIKADLQKSLVTALRELHSKRPPPEQVYSFLVDVLEGKPPPEVLAVAKEEDQGVYEYFKTKGVFSLLKPALIAVDKHRPKDPQKYLATFLDTLVTEL